MSLNAMKTKKSYKKIPPSQVRQSFKLHCHILDK